MTWTLALLALGTVAVRSALENRPILDILRGVAGSIPGGPGEHGFETELAEAAATKSDAQTPDTGAGSRGNRATGTETFDGQDVAAWIVPWLKKIRATGIWHGQVTSGYRSVADQRAACVHVCGNAGGCPGTCAAPGQSNHQKTRFPGGAVDVSDEANFALAARRVHAPLRNNLPSDRVHFSVSGT